MDTTFVTIMLVVFLVLTGLAVDIGYMYVSEEDLQSAAETAALAGMQQMKQRMLTQFQQAPGKVAEVLRDPLQTAAREAAVETVNGKQSAAALVGLANNDSNAFSGDNDITVGFWNMSSRSYTPGGTPVNAMQVRTRRTAESSTVGLGNLGSFLATVNGTVSFGLTPVATAAIPAGTSAHIAVCGAACDSSCSYPNVCTIPQRRMSRPNGGDGSAGYLYTSLLHPASITNSMSDLVCQETPTQEVCGKPIYTTAGTGDATLRDLRSVMYDSTADHSNKEYDKDGRLLGWWLLAPRTDCVGVRAQNIFEQRTATGYVLVRISKICAGGTAGCGQQPGKADRPAQACGPGEEGLYIDRISCVGCDSKSKVTLPGLHPVLVEPAVR